jgi:hypothetical protein
MGAGRKMRKSRKGRKASRKSRKGTKARKARKGTKSRKGRKASRKMMYGGGGPVYNMDPASTKAPGMLLDPAMEARAVRGMNPEWYLAEDPKAFNPK